MSLLHCDYKASCKRHLKVHASVTHNIMEYKCDKCDFTAKRKLYASQHELTFHGIEEHFCNQCGVKVRWWQGLRKHIREKHT